LASKSALHSKGAVELKQPKGSNWSPVANVRVVFGCYECIEKCAADGGSSLDADYREFTAFDAKQMEGYARASLAFLESCLIVMKGRFHPYSYALARMFSSFESAWPIAYSTLRGALGVADRSGWDASSEDEHHSCPLEARWRAFPLAMSSRLGGNAQIAFLSDPRAWGWAAFT
jgi:hypothetical protein